MDFNALRAQTLGSGTDEEAVTVNTRALIDKVLARYSGEWTVLRELLQNAADASATKIIIKFETLPSSIIPVPQPASPSNVLKHTLQNHTLKRLVVTNNGQPFSENDWSRLKRIAEGNPDETKIGAFGVGFYSTFADCEEPFVSSGREAMAFFWKSNSLFTRRLKLPESDTTSETNFVLDYRDQTSPVPSLLPLAQFLANSLTFVGLQHIELWVDSWNILSLVKKTSPSSDVVIPKEIETKTTEGFMKVSKVIKEVAQIDGQWMKIVGWKAPKQNANRTIEADNAPSLRKFFSRLAGTTGPAEMTASTTNLATTSQINDLTERVSATVFLNVNTATIRTSTTSKFNEELERATKKPPPKTTRLAILTAPYIENNTLDNIGKAGDVFATVLPTKNGKIFIGFPTFQTTGLNAHISAPSVIPTVERESIDLNARYVRTWNIEMLRAAGIVCRIAWISEMAELKDKIVRSADRQTKIRLENVTSHIPTAATTLQNYTFRESTPSPKTGQILEDAFWTCCKKASIEVLSTCGVLPTHEVRLAPKDLTFMEGIPTVPEALMSQAKAFIDKLIDFGLLTEVTVSDIKTALESNSLTSSQVSEFLEWLTKQAVRGQLDMPTINNLLSVTVANDENRDGSPTKVLLLAQIQHFLNPSRTPVDYPVPPTVMPFKFTKTLTKHELESIGWVELQIVPWIRWLLAESGNRMVLQEDQDLTRSTIFSGQILPILSKQWDSLSQSSKATLVEMLASRTVIPTKLGMKKPAEAYFPNVRLFDDLATVTGLSAVKDKFLVALGVRKTIELGVVFDRLLALDSKAQKADNITKPMWSHVELIQYLASVRDDIPGTDIQRLRNTPICLTQNAIADGPQSMKRYKVSELFEPRPELKTLGLPVLSWPGVYRSSSAEGKLLSSLGLRTVPSVPELIEIMAKAGSSGDLELRDKALTYFLSHHHSHGYSQYDYSSVKLAFLPLENKPDQLSTPNQCFVDPGAALLGFDILKKELVPHHQRFGVSMHPPMDICISILMARPPKTHRDAREMFTYFAGRLSEITPSNIPRLADLKFIPVFTKNKEKSIFQRHISPKSCFLGESDTYGDIFDYVDFGHEANMFLLRCGSKPEPSKIEVAQILVREPARISATFSDPEKYLALLRSMADSIATLKKHKDLFREMKKAPFLLASRELSTPQATRKTNGTIGDDEIEDEDEVQGIREYQLCSAPDAIIMDDFLTFNLFKSNILAAPQEETLEEFYIALGSPLLSSLVEEAARHGPRSHDQRPAQRLQKLIFERSRLFLHDQPSDAIKHDAKWLEKNIQVVLVSSISLRRSLKGRDVSHTSKRTAVLTNVNKEYILWISGERPDLYQVSQALIHVLLNRPKTHSALTLEMFLKTDLYDLRARGFNVSRILRQKEAEARLAESKRQQQLEEEKRQIAEQETAWLQAQEEEAKEKAKKKRLPGQFPDSPESKSLTKNGGSNLPLTLNDTQSTSTNPFANLTHQFGRRFQNLLGQQPADPLNGKQLQSPQQTEMDAPPPYQQDTTQGQTKTTQSSVTAPHQLRENLLSAVRKTRAHNSTDLFSRGETNVVSETKSYCDEHPAQDLKLVAQLPHSIQMFLSPSSVANASEFLQTHSSNLNIFANLLASVGDIFSLSPRVLNVFHETSGKTIAFNRSGSIFCNYWYFEQLHLNSMKAAPAGTFDPDTFVYWWVILCHELAHNLVGDHSSDHSYYTEGFVAHYFGRVVQKIGAMSASASAVPRIESA